MLRRPQKLTKSSLPIWHYEVSVKSMVKISSIFVAFLENKNFNVENSHWEVRFWHLLTNCLSSQNTTIHLAKKFAFLDQLLKKFQHHFYPSNLTSRCSMYHAIFHNFYWLWIVWYISSLRTSLFNFISYFYSTGPLSMQEKIMIQSWMIWLIGL